MVDLKARGMFLSRALRQKCSGNLLYLVSGFVRPLFLHLQIDWARKTLNIDTILCQYPPIQHTRLHPPL